MAARPKRPRDTNQLAKMIVDLSVGEAIDVRPPVQTTKMMAGKIGGLIGGNARAKALTSQQRTKIARKAAYSRWKKKTTAT